MEKQYIEEQYHLAMLDYKTAVNEDKQWEARRTMARLEALAIESFGEDFQKELRQKELNESGSKDIPEGAPRRYRLGQDGQMHRTWNGKLPEEFSGQDAAAFLADTDQKLDEMSQEDAARFVEEYSRKIEKLVEDNKNFPIGDSSLFPFVVPKGSHAAVRYASIKKSSRFETVQAAEDGVEMKVTAAIYKDGTLNEYDQGIAEKKFTLKGIDAINEFSARLERSVKDSIKARPDIQPVVTVNFSEYENYNPLVGDHMRLSLDRANSLFELIDIVAKREAGDDGRKASYRTSADIMFVQNGKIGHFDFYQDFGKSSGSILKHIESYMDEQISYWSKHLDQPNGKKSLNQWETAKKELIPYFERHISLSRAERDLEYMGKAAAVMQDNIFEMRAFLNTGEILPVPEKEQPEQTQETAGETPVSEQEASPAPAPESAATVDNRVYLELPHVSKERFPALLQELKQKGAKFDRERKQWYVDQKSADSGVFNAYIRTYLHLPPMGKEEFASVTAQLKQDGAHYDGIQKKWYIDANSDKSRFQAYLVQNFAELTTEPTITIVKSQHSHLKKGDTMSLSEANALMESFDKEAFEDFEGDIAFETMYRIDFVMDGKLDHYEGKQYLGEGNGTLVHNIEKLALYLKQDGKLDHYEGKQYLREGDGPLVHNIERLVPYLKLHCNLSDMDRISRDALQNRDKLPPAEIAHHTAMQKYVSKCRRMVNQGNYNLPPAPQLKEERPSVLNKLQSARETQTGKENPDLTKNMKQQRRQEKAI